MNKTLNREVGAIVLAAGKGKRMSSTVKNKVVLKFGGKPMIQYAVELLKKLQIKTIVVVVGFAKESVIKILDNQVAYVVQHKRLGTGHAVSCALKKIPQEITDVLVINGDDSVFYTADLTQKLIKKHYDFNAELTFLTIEKENPYGFGRIIRDKNKELLAIVEEKDASALQKKIKEVNPQCFIFKTSFLKKYLRKIKKNKITKEYYLTDIISAAIKNNERIKTLPVGKIPWLTINTKEELLEAEKLISKAHK